MTILVDTPAVIHIAPMLLHHLDFAQNLHQIPDLLMGRLVGKGKLGLVVDLLIMVAPALVRGDFGQVQLQADFSVICLEIEGTKSCSYSLTVISSEFLTIDFLKISSTRPTHTYRTAGNDYSDNAFWGGTTQRGSGNSSGGTPSTGTRTASGFGGTTRR